MEPRPANEIPSWLPPLVWTAALLFPLLAISGQSFWIDEAITGNAARQATVAGCWGSLQAINGSDLQMPLYMLGALRWAKLFGASEVSLRLLNFPFFVIGQIAAARIWPDRRKGYIFILLAASSSFLWYYLGEARPYGVEYGIAAVILYYLSSLMRDDVCRPSQYWGFACALVALAGVNMLGTAWVGTALLVSAYYLTKHRRKPPAVPLLFCGVALGLLGCYYLWTIRSGARATVFSMNLLLGAPFLVYELCGFGGLGPGRLDIRSHGLSSFVPFLLPLVLFAFLILFIFARALRALSREAAARWVLTAAIFALPPVVFLLLVGLVADFRVLGRHVMPSLPFVFVLLTEGIASLRSSGARWAKITVAGFFLLSLVACLEVRFSPRHRRDNYREAVATVLKLWPNDRVVWWCASRPAAIYYRLPLARREDFTAPFILDVRNPTVAQTREMTPPDLVVLSKADLFDEKGVIAETLSAGSFVPRKKLQGLTIWERSHDRVKR